jgi:hypothetical protein
MDFGDNEGCLTLSEARREKKAGTLTIAGESSFSGE